MSYKKTIKYWPLRKALITSWLMLGVTLTYHLAFLIRFEAVIPVRFQLVENKHFALVLTLSFVILFLFKQFTGLWRYYSIHDVFTSGTSVITLAIFLYISNRLYPIDYRLPRSIILLFPILFGSWLLGSRMVIRYIKESYRSTLLNKSSSDKRALIIGSIKEADLLIRACKKDFDGRFVAIQNTNKEFDSRHLHGVKVLQQKLADTGILALTKNITDIHVLDPYNSPNHLREIVDSCSEAGAVVKFHTIPRLKDMASGDVSASMIRDVEITDLLGRNQNNLDRVKIDESISAKKVLVTGAGGSIGSEICRQVLSHDPELIVLYEFSEFALYSIEKELTEKYPDKKIIAFSGDIRHKEELRQAISQVGGIDLIYHAAAYKHVPLMEANVPAAFRNNVLGTARVAEVAEEMKVKRMVMISSDKAVRPSNIMGATKRIAERILQERSNSGTEFVAVRFGNVLGSSGSVIPLFKRQIAEGKPLTVTSKNMCRFFMTIPEACELVLMCGAVAKPSQIMVLEMGEPVKIYDLAVKLIELSGLRPNEDVKIEFSGLRPGEKEYEEILTDDEDVIETEYERIWMMQKDAKKQAAAKIDLEQIINHVHANEAEELRQLAQIYVPENTFKGGGIETMPDQLIPQK